MKKCLTWKNVRRSLSDVWVKLIQRRLIEEQSTIEGHFDPYSWYKSENYLSIKTIKHSDSETIKALIKSAYPLEVEDITSEITPMMTAIMNGDYEEAKTQHHAQMLQLLDQMNHRMHENIRTQEWSKLEISTLEDLVLKLKAKGWDSEEIGEILAKITSELQIQDVVWFNDSDITKGFLQIQSEPFLRDTYRAFEIVTPTLDFEHIKVILENNLGKNVTQLMFCRYIMNNIDYYHKTRSGRLFLKRVFSWDIFNGDSIEYLQTAFLEADIKCRKIFMKYDFHLNVKAEYGRDLRKYLFSNCHQKEEKQFGYDKWIYSNQNISLSREKRKKLYERGHAHCVCV